MNPKQGLNLQLIRKMAYSSINEDFKGLEVVHQESQHAKLYLQVTKDTTFLRNLTFMKQDNDASDVGPLQSSSVDRHQEYALYRQRCLVMYNPLRTFEKKEDKMSLKKRITKEGYKNNHGFRFMRVF